MRAATYLNSRSKERKLFFFDLRKADGKLLWECPTCKEGSFDSGPLLPKLWWCDCCGVWWANTACMVGAFAPTYEETSDNGRDRELDDSDGGYGDDSVMEMDEEEE